MKKLIVLAALTVAAQAALAGTGYYLVSTYPEAGERTVDFKYWNAKPSGRPPRSAPELGLGYNVNARWFTELSASWFQLSPGPLELAALEWQNDVMLTQGQYPVDVALHTTLERPRDASEGYGVEFGPVMQTELGRTQFNLNLFFSRDYRSATANAMQLAYQWQVKYRWKPALEFGVQGFGEVGEWDHWSARDQQSHRIGPALFGHIDGAGKQQWKYEAAYLIGTNSARNAKTVTLRLQYVF